MLLRLKNGFKSNTAAHVRELGNKTFIRKGYFFLKDYHHWTVLYAEPQIVSFSFLFKLAFSYRRS